MPGDLVIRAADRDGNVLSPLPEASVKSLSLELSKPPSLTFDLHLDHARQFAVAPDAEVVAIREGDTVPLFMGVPWTASKSSGSRALSVVAEGIETRLMRRFVVAQLSYLLVEQFQIGWNLIAHTQAQPGGDLNITRAAVPDSGVDRSRTYSKYDLVTIHEALDAYRKIINGFDWAIVPASVNSREWVAYYPSRGATHPEWSLGFGDGTRRNVVDYGLVRDLASYVTRGYVSGAGDGANRQLDEYADPDLGTTKDLFEAHKRGPTNISFGNFGANGYAQAFVEARNTVPTIVSEVSVSGPTDLIDNVRPGDVLPLRIVDGWVSVDADYRVVKADWPPTFDRVTLTVEPT